MYKLREGSETGDLRLDDVVTSNGSTAQFYSKSSY